MKDDLKMTLTQEYALRRFFWHHLMKNADFDRLRIYVGMLHLAAMVRAEQMDGGGTLPAHQVAKAKAMANGTWWLSPAGDFDPERSSLTGTHSSLTRFPYNAYKYGDHVQIAKARALDAIVHTLALLPEFAEIIALAEQLPPVQSAESFIRRTKQLNNRLREILTDHLQGALAGVPASRVAELKTQALDWLSPRGAVSPAPAWR